MTQTQNMQQNPVSDLMYDWLTVLQSKCEGINAYEKYLRDADNEKADECRQLFNKLREQDIQMVGEIKDHLKMMFDKQQQRSGMQAGQQQEKSQQQGQSVRH